MEKELPKSDCCNSQVIREDHKYANPLTNFWHYICGKCGKICEIKSEGEK
jgi:hypothetical protein